MIASTAKRELVVGREEVRPEAEADVRAEVAQDLALAELLVDRLELGDAHRDRAAAALRVARAHDLEAGRVEQADQAARSGAIEFARIASTPTSSTTS